MSPSALRTRSHNQMPEQPWVEDAVPPLPLAWLPPNPWPEQNISTTQDS